MVSLSSISVFAVASELSPAKEATTPKSAHALIKPETIKGTLSLVELNKGIIVVTDPSGVPFDFKLAHAKIEVNGSRAKATALQTETGKQVSVEFLPLRSGDVAQRIVVGQ